MEEKLNTLNRDENTHSYDESQSLKDRKPYSQDYERQESPEAVNISVGGSFDHKESQSTRNIVISDTQDKNPSSLACSSPTSVPTIEKKDQSYTRFSPRNSDKTDPPAMKSSEENEIKDYKGVSAKVTKPGGNYRKSDSAGKYIRDSPGNFRRAEGKRESPRYAEPVRKHSSRDNFCDGGYRKESPSLKGEGKKISADLGSGNAQDRGSSADRRGQMQKVPNSPMKDPIQKVSEYYKDSPTVRPMPKPRNIELGRDSPKRSNMEEASKTFPNTFENILKYYSQNEPKSASQINTITKPPVRRTKPY
ncbi:hypothetical protein SteCoe_7173 [Stentor coeruleus]|uniref:Uncharacterized protein n=1 Tax=Stentor coeruleus TaxID=5963 RepID=A0A1R2CNA9_9CILI|nr:hypothetical protein SteCoe_7173 [Stentor coeruleus]